MCLDHTYSSDQDLERLCCPEACRLRSALYLLQQANCPLLSLEAAPGLLSDGYDVCGNAENSHAELISRLGVAMNLCG